MNLNKPWKKIKDQSSNVVYASHLFEHLKIGATNLFLQEAYRALSNGGAIRLVMPDLYLLSKNYIKKYEEADETALDEYMWALNLHREGQYPKGSFKHHLIGWIQGYPHQHKFMYDKPTLTKMLEKVGFKDIVFCDYGESQYVENVNEIEYDASLSYAHSVFVEAIKPK